VVRESFALSSSRKTAERSFERQRVAGVEKAAAFELFLSLSAVGELGTSRKSRPTVREAPARPLLYTQPTALRCHTHYELA
jgi:hypothetical protein